MVVEALVLVEALLPILKKVVIIIASNIALVLGYEEKLTTLHRTLDLIHAKLRDAERQKGTEAVMVWLRQLKHVVDEADDMLDEIHYEMLRDEVGKQDRMARWSSYTWSFHQFRKEMGNRIENINKRLFEISKQAKSLGLQNEQLVGSVPGSVFRETDPYLDEFKTFGREDDVQSIITLFTLSRKEEKLTIVPIVGMGGIGKTVLAKLVYNNPMIEQHFDVRVWLCVAVKVDVNTLLAKIYESVAGEQSMSQTRVNLIANLRNKLGSKRYLLVLDDVWDEEKAHWDDFRSCMLKVNSHNGNGILVTTRNLKIGTNVTHEGFRVLQGLSDEDCWSTFRERAFGEGESPSPELEEIGRDIAKKCNGVPLSVHVRGGMLRNHRDKEKWLSIKDCKVCDQAEEGDRVPNSLRLSFDNLPNSIARQCFAYCSIFQKDTLMKREELIQLWMALGLIQEDETINKEMEDVGNDVFQNLVRNSLFQDVERDEYGYATGFRMHDLVHELSLSLSKPEILCLVAPKNDDIFRIPHVKHLAMYQSLEHDVQIDIASMAFKEDMTARTLHTLFFIGEIQKKFSFQRFKCVRIVKFKGCRLVKIDDSIGELVHLRYLDLSYTEICVLPKSIGKLYHLQTLKLVGCRNLKDLPKEMRNLISLRYLEFQPSIPTHMVGRLINLRTFSLFKLGQETRCQIKELGGLKHLRGELNISNLEEISSKEDAAKADLFGKKDLSEFGFLWSSNKGENRNDKDVLEGLQPHGNVKSLKIKNFSGDKFPAWVAQMAIDIDGRWAPLNKLVKITLSGCNSCISLRMLEDLPLLQGLVFWDMNNLTCFKSSLGEADDVTGSMKPLSPSLRSLQLVGMKSLEKWIDGATNSSTLISPVLERLEIEDCPKIILLDECHPHPLVYLEISNCENFASVQSIEGLTSLESLAINGCPRLLELPSLHSRGHSLKKLCIVGCQELSSLPCNIFECFTFLQELALGPFSKELNSFPSLQGIEKLKNHLHSLNLYGCRHWETIPEEVQHLTSLTQFFIIGFGMGELPVWLTDMSSIRDLKFLGCKGLDKDSVKRGAPRGAKVIQLNGWHV